MPPHVPFDERALIHDILRRAQLDPTCYRLPALARRIPACLRMLRAKGVAEAASRLETQPEAFEPLVNTLLIGVTDFFRDSAPYDHLRTQVLPALIKHSPAPRILSAACSDGAELFSLAMCLAEHNANAYFLGIDCRQQPLDTAQAAWYPSAALGAIPPNFRERFLLPAKNGFHIADSLRSNAHWLKSDICSFTADAPFDLIACRNITIYLEPHAADHLWQRLHAALRPGGILFAGKAERPPAPFVRVAPCLFAKV